jgi:hypothetical protein
MKAFEFQTCLGTDATIPVPPQVAGQIGPNRPVRVIVLVPDFDDDREWSRLVTEQFLKGYAEGDAIYDDVPAG